MAVSFVGAGNRRTRRTFYERKKCIEYSKHKSIYRYTLEQSVFIKTISHDNHMANGVRRIMVFNGTFNNHVFKDCRYTYRA
jgi:hypothetical protein